MIDRVKHQHHASFTFTNETKQLDDVRAHFENYM